MVVHQVVVLRSWVLLSSSQPMPVCYCVGPIPVSSEPSSNTVVSVHVCTCTQPNWDHPVQAEQEAITLWERSNLGHCLVGSILAGQLS